MTSAAGNAHDLPALRVPATEAPMPVPAAGPASMPDRPARAATLRRFVLALQTLVNSAEPAVVFTGLVRLCVPSMCDRCAVAIVEEQMPGYRIEFPPPAAASGLDAIPPADMMLDCAGAEQVLSIPILGRPGHGQDDRGDYRGVLTCLWRDGHQPTDAEAAIAQLAVDHAILSVHRARLIVAVSFAEAKAANLQIALASNRDIGVAIGIVMSRHLISREAAFELLRAASQHSHRKLRDIAGQVADTGELPAFTQQQATGRTARDPLRAVPEHAAQ